MGPDRTDTERLCVIEEKLDALHRMLTDLARKYGADHDELIRVKTTLRNTWVGVIVFVPAVAALIAWLFDRMDH